MSNYSELLKHPKWQKKRLKILERDKFECKSCGANKKTLHVHHLYYQKGLKPWEYENYELITLCEDCHNTITELRKNNIDSIYAYLVCKCVIKQIFSWSKTGTDNLCDFYNKELKKNINIKKLNENFK